MANQTADLEEMTVAELKEFAASEGIHIPAHANKDEIIQLIEQGQPSGNPGANQKDAPTQQASVTPFVGVGYQPPPTFGPQDLVVPAYVPNPQPLKIADAYGNGAEYQLALNVIQLAAGQPVAGRFLLDTIPPGMIVNFVRIKDTVPVLGTGGTVLAAVSDDVNAYGGTFDCTQAVSDAAMLTFANSGASPLVGHFSTPTPLYLTFSGTGTLANATQGAVTVWVHYLLLA